MATLKDKHLPVVKNLYYGEKMSMQSVASRLGISIDAVSYFMRRHRLERRSVLENEVIKFDKKPLSYRLKNKLSTFENKLKLAGIMLYWGEGYKTIKSKGIDFANSDVSMIVAFINFLRQICGVDERRLRVLLYCYSNQNPESLIDFWSKLTKIPKSQFTKPYVRHDFHPDKEGKMKYGMVHIRYSDKKLLTLLLEWIDEFKREYCVDGGVVNRNRL